jgi:hypothetical protein
MSASQEREVRLHIYALLARMQREHDEMIASETAFDRRFGRLFRTSPPR